MPTIVGYHDITKGQDHWLRSPKRKELFGPLDVTNIRTFVDPQNPRRVAVMMDVPDMEALNAVMQSPAAARQWPTMAWCPRAWSFSWRRKGADDERLAGLCRPPATPLELATRVTRA